MFDNFIHYFYYLFFYYKKGEKTKKSFVLKILLTYRFDCLLFLLFIICLYKMGDKKRKNRI